MPRFSFATSLFSLILLLSGGVTHSLTAQEPATSWSIVKVPEVWKRTPPGLEGRAWYRAFVKLPAAWQGSNLEVFVEPSDAAHEVYFNGQKIGSAGEFPPFFRSGLGGTDRFFVPANLVKADGLNVVALRHCQQDGRTGFNLAPPVVFGASEAIRLSGNWQYRPGDSTAWARFDELTPPAEATLFARLDNAVEVAASLKKLDNDDGPLTAAEALKRFVVPDDLQIELAVGEPDVRQPLSVKWDSRGRMWVVQFIQYPEPAGLKMLSRDKFLRSVYDKTPQAPPHHVRGQDKVTIHEDTDGDGRYDSHKTFVDGLSLVSSVAIDKDGVWVLNPPYLLYYPDANHDDVPDGDPQVHLQGFGIEDSHSIANNLRWGPDGWLYGAQGSTVTAAIIRPGIDKQPMHSLGQCIWRYHPATKRYEVFAEGGGNAFGLELDTKGRLYSGHNGGNTRGFHYVQGGYYRKGFEKHGALSNPYTFGFFEAMAHHNVPRFTNTFVINEGGALSEKYRGSLFGVGPLQSHIVRASFEPDRSSFKTKDLDHPVTTADTWFRPVDIQVGPDGAIYIVDLYEQRIDHASHYQGRIDRERGRIWRLSAKGAKLHSQNLTKLASAELIDKLGDANRTTRQAALETLARRDDPKLNAQLVSRIAQSTGDDALGAFWALAQRQGLDEASALRALDHANPYVRLWAVRLLGDEKRLSSELAKRLDRLAQQETNVEVRSQLAASARRLSVAEAWPIVRQMLAHDADAQDIHIPLLVWWAIEAKADSDRDAVLELFAEEQLWQRPLFREQLLERLMRRYATAGSRKDLLACAALLQRAPDKDSAARLLQGFEKAFEGRSLSALPEELIAALAASGGGSLALRLRQGQADALADALRIVADEQAKASERVQLVQILGEIHPVAAVDVLLKLVTAAKDDTLRAAALTALMPFDSEPLGRRVVAAYGSLSSDVRSVADTLLSSRKAWTLAWLQAIDSGEIPAKSISADVVRKMLFHREPRIAELVKKHWGEIQGATSAEMHKLIERYQGVISSAAGNPYQGRKLFMGNCGKCHVLFAEGGRIGPDLTSYKRDDLTTMLVNVVNPSAQIREGYENFVVVTTDGRTLNGFIADQDSRVVVIRGIDGQSVIISRGDIEELAAIPRSVMPEGALKDFTDEQVRDLFAYLRSTQPLATK